MQAHQGHVSAWLGQDEAGFDIAEAPVLLKPLLEHLTDRERLMLEMRFFRGATEAEIGQAIGVTQMQVSRLLSDLMGRLREQLRLSSGESSTPNREAEHDSHATRAGLRPGHHPRRRPTRAKPAVPDRTRGARRDNEPGLGPLKTLQPPPGWSTAPRGCPCHAGATVRLRPNRSNAPRRYTPSDDGARHWTNIDAGSQVTPFAPDYPIWGTSVGRTSSNTRSICQAVPGGMNRRRDWIAQERLRGAAAPSQPVLPGPRQRQSSTPPIRHCWVTDEHGRLPGLLLEWRRTSSGAGACGAAGARGRVLDCGGGMAAG